MTTLGSLFDKNGRLLPPEQCNIKPLNSLTKHRAKSPARRSPSRNGKSSSGSEPNDRCIPSTPKLPTFVQEVNHNKTAQLTSPTALRPDTVLIDREKTSVNSAAKITVGKPKFPDKQSADSTHSPGDVVKSRSESHKKKITSRKMESDGESVEAKFQLLDKPVPLWSTEDVCLWLDHVQLQNLKQNFTNQGVTGKTLLSLNYETLEDLGLSNARGDREHFLAEVYNLQPESDEVDDEETDKEIEETLRGAYDNEQDHGKIFFPSLNTESDVASSASFASSSRTGSEREHTMNGDEARPEVASGQRWKQISSKNNSHYENHNATTNESKTKKESSKYGDKKRKPRGKRISRFWSSRHHGNKGASILDTAPPIYKNAFHNLMNSGPQGVIKVWTEMFLTDMQYVSLLVRHDATAYDVVKMVLEKSNAVEDPECYRICEINGDKNEYVLDKNESPLQRERMWSDPDNCRFELRWRNERLIEWGNTSGSIAQDLSLQKPDQDAAVEQNHVGSPSREKPQLLRQKQSISSPDSSQSGDPFMGLLETAVDDNSEVEHMMKRNGSEDTLVIDDSSDGVTSAKRLNGIAAVANGLTDYEILRNEQNLRGVLDSGKNQESSLLGTKHLTSSCPDLTRVELFEDGIEVGVVPVEPEGDKATTDGSTVVDEEFEYSQRLRKSSKKLSRKLKLEADKTKRDGRDGETRIRGDTEEHMKAKTEDVPDGKIIPAEESKGAEDLPGLVVGASPQGDIMGSSVEKIIGDHSGTVGEVVEVNVALGEQNHSNEASSQISAQVTSPEVSSPEVASQEVEVFRKRIAELEKENLLLMEDNRNLKKSCRTFEGKSRLKERELEDLEEDKDNLRVQMQEMASDLHFIRAENTELRTSLAEANTKLSDVDGWVTRDVFEDIRGQLSLSLEEVEEKEEEVNEAIKKIKELKEENQKISGLESEVDQLNQRIKEGDKERERLQKDLKDKDSKIRDLEAEHGKLQTLIEDKDKEKKDVDRKLEEADKEIDSKNKRHAEEVKDWQKRMSDREYEILIMKEEKKELCVKMKGFESNVEALREEMKKKDGEHEAAIAELNEQSAIKDQSLSVTVSTLEQLVNERDMRIKQLKNQLALAGKPESELQAKEHEYEQNKVYLKHLIALVKEKDPALLDMLNQTLSSRDSDDWC